MLSGEAFSHCRNSFKGEFSDVQLNVVFNEFEDGVRAMENLFVRSPAYSSNPIALILEGRRQHLLGSFELAIGFYDIAVFVAAERALCSLADLVFISTVLRRASNAELLKSSEGEQYLGITRGHVNTSLELLSQDEDRAVDCLMGMSLDSQTGRLISNCRN